MIYKNLLTIFCSSKYHPSKNKAIFLCNSAFGPHVKHNSLIIRRKYLFKTCLKPVRNFRFRTKSIFSHKSSKNALLCENRADDNILIYR